MVSNAGRMVAALAMVTGSVLPERRGGFMSANSSVQHLATGFGASLGGMIVGGGKNSPLTHFDRVGWIAMALTLLSMYLAGRLKPATPNQKPITPEQSLASAAEALCDVGEPLAEAGIE